MNDAHEPDWVKGARRYYSQIRGDSGDPVTVFSVSEGFEAISSTSPGTPRLHLEPNDSGWGLHVLTADGSEAGVVRSVVPGLKYVMRRGDAVVWTLSVRSVVRKRHRLVLAGGETWTFDTPFFWWQHLTGSIGGVPKLLGCIGPRKFLWMLWVEPGRDTDDVLAAVASMHRSWWHL